MAQGLALRHNLGTLIMGCTEIPLALKSLSGMPQVNLADPAQLLARALARSAYDPAPNPHKT